MEVPKEYEGREQSFLKHRVLEEYLLVWGLKLGSVARERHVRLCYVDGFAGPWKTKDAALRDSSIAIGLDALEAASKTWRNHGVKVDIEAAFVEQGDAAFSELERYLKNRGGTIKTFARHGEFGTFIPELQQWMGRDAGLIFVDPTGWKGAAMRYIAPLTADHPRRDVLVNVMFDHINRFKDDEREFLRQQMSDFFGLGSEELPEGLAEGQLLALYRTKLKELCKVTYAADLAIPHPTMARTKFRLVVGGKSPEVLVLFRDIEKKVVGREAASVRDAAQTRVRTEKMGQPVLFAAPPPTDGHYDSLHRQSLTNARAELLSRTSLAHPVAFGALWPSLLEGLHMTKTELAQIVWDLKKEGYIDIVNAQPRQRTARDEHLLQRKG